MHAAFSKKKKQPSSFCNSKIEQISEIDVKSHCSIQMLLHDDGKTANLNRPVVYVDSRAEHTFNPGYKGNTEKRGKLPEPLAEVFSRKVLRSIPCLYVNPKRKTSASACLGEYAEILVYFHANAEDLMSTLSFAKYLSQLARVIYCIN